MANMTSCLELVNRIDEQDQNTLLGRLDELQAAGWEPDIAQAKAARYALAAIEAESRASAPVDQTQTDAFRKWFGDSKVVDADGRPLVVYHGSTRGGISHNTVQKSFFTSSVDVATTYSKDDYSGSIGESPTVQEMYLRIENPLEIDASGEPWMRIEFEGLRHTTDDLAALARRRGHDGLIVRNVEDNVSDEELPPSDIYVTLGGRSQIKSANNNDGQFDPSNPDIRRSAERQTDTPEFRNWSKGLPVYEDAVGVTGRGIYKVYHATRGDHSILKPGGSDPTLSGKAIWLSPHAGHQAAMHNIMSRDGFRDGVNVMPLYARIERPLVIDDLVMLEWAREVFANGSREFPQLMTDQARAEVLKEYDSIILDGPSIGWNGETGEVIVFDSTQIKSAIGNSGAFDPRDANITRSAARDLPKATLADFEPRGISRLLGVDNWAILAAENPMGEQAGDKTNAAAMRRLRQRLAEMDGVEYRAIRGKYGDNEENSLAVVGITEEQAKELGREFNQDSVFTRKGFIYQDGSINPATGIEVFRNAPDNYYSRIGDTIFRIDIDFDTTISPEVARARRTGSYAPSAGLSDGDLATTIEPRAERNAELVELRKRLSVLDSIARCMTS